MCILATVLLRCMLFEVLYFLMQVALTRCWTAVARFSLQELLFGGGMYFWVCLFSVLFVSPKYSRHSMLADEAFGLMGFNSCMIALLV
jgi:hypothetical protein